MEPKNEEEKSNYVKKIFKKMDKDEDGFLVKDEMTNFIMEGFRWVSWPIIGWFQKKDIRLKLKSESQFRLNFINSENFLLFSNY